MTAAWHDSAPPNPAKGNGAERAGKRVAAATAHLRRIHGRILGPTPRAVAMALAAAGEEAHEAVIAATVGLAPSTTRRWLQALEGHDLATPGRRRHSWSPTPRIMDAERVAWTP